MTSKDREFGGTALNPDSLGFGCTRALSATQPAGYLATWLRQGHAFYVFTADNLFAGGSPFCSK